MTSVRTPLNTGQALALGGGSHRYRKQLLKRGPLHYQGGIVDISDEMIGSIVEAFDAKAQTRVPFQLADATNSHTMDPLRRKGFVTALHQTSEGLDGIIELEDEAAALVDSDPEFGVSVLVSPVETGEGGKWPAVLQHVLGTYSPVVTSLTPWSIAASQPQGNVIDLLALAADTPTSAGGNEVTAAERAVVKAQRDLEQAQRAVARAQSAARTPSSPSSDEGADPDPSEEDFPVPSLKDLLDNASEDELKALREKLDTLAPSDDGVTVDDAADVDVLGDEDITDDELEEASAIVADLFADDENEESADDTADTEEPVAVAASQAASDEADRLALANAQLSEQGLALSQMRRELDDARWVQERDALILSNVPPVLVELAKPFLHGSDARLALSQDGKTKAAAQIRKMLGEVAGQLKLGINTAPVGTSIDASEEAEARQAADTRKSTVSATLQSAGLLGNQGRRS